MTHSETLIPLGELYLADETAWLEQMAVLAAQRQTAAMDLPNLSEYLSDMARRDKREVVSRLVVLLVHLLKWEYQADKRTRGWELTIAEQREELEEIFESATLRNQAEQELSKAYQKAVRRAAVETELAETAFPVECPYSLEQIVGN